VFGNDETARRSAIDSPVKHAADRGVLLRPIGERRGVRGAQALQRILRFFARLLLELGSRRVWHRVKSPREAHQKLRAQIGAVLGVRDFP
jgi:hypothetical protein